jgi:hypothetical protein
MSKIMRQLYAEARAAREAKANPGDHRRRVAQTAAWSSLKWWSLPVSNPTASARRTIEWWIHGVAETGESFRRRDADVEPLPAQHGRVAP